MTCEAVIGSYAIRVLINISSRYESSTAWCNHTRAKSPRPRSNLIYATDPLPRPIPACRSYITLGIRRSASGTVRLPPVQFGLCKIDRLPPSHLQTRLAQASRVVLLTNWTPEHGLPQGCLHPKRGGVAAQVSRSMNQLRERILLVESFWFIYD